MAIDRYLASKVEVASLDGELGLRARRGAKRKPATSEELEWGRKALALRINGKSWAEVASDIGWQQDESSLRELLKRISPDVIERLAVDARSSDAEDSATSPPVGPGSNTR